MVLFAKCRKMISVLGLLAAVSVGCTPDFEAEYSDPNEQEIVDDKWNETDARKTSESMITDMLGSAWMRDFKKVKKRKPVVVVMDIENRTDEHLDTKALTEAISNELIRSGRVTFVNKARRQQILEEIGYHQSGHVSKDSAKKTGRQVGADYILAGAISSKVAVQGNYKKVTYMTNLRLTNLETTIDEWTNIKEISKKFKRSGSSW